ncbi:LysR family transcriptional regulator [Luteimonas sp. Y-2-2-4F]|nr:LysR family transcriptional regulator [Luteimonas sp. Y-2-2-4F]MCD9033031.1 LysR family transcriptional regulator [Luteimonas sp. Y-2-2-4F]
MAAIEDLTDLRIFERIVARGTLSAAARELGLSLAVVSKRLSELERRLETRLLHRSTRRLSMTGEGALFHGHCLRVLDEAEAAEAALLGRQRRVAGTLRISAPHSLGRRQVAPALAEFARTHPGLDVRLSLSDDLVDLVAGGFDLAVRYGVLADSRLVARRLAPNRRVLVAAPAYVERRGLPARLEDLQAHDCILIGQSPNAQWGFGRAQRPVQVRVRGAFVCNDGEGAHALALEGAGIALKSIWDVGDDLESGRLVQVLSAHAESAAPLHAVYPQGRQQAPRVRLFVQQLARRLQAAWRWGPPAR